MTFMAHGGARASGQVSEGTSAETAMRWQWFVRSQIFASGLKSNRQ